MEMAEDSSMIEPAARSIMSFWAEPTERYAGFCAALSEDHSGRAELWPYPDSA